MKAKISGKTCPFPGSLPHGNWTCEMQEIPILGTSFLDEDAQSYPALQCRLECEPGYVAQRTPLITCVNGEYAKGCHYLQQIIILTHTFLALVSNVAIRLCHLH